MPVVCITPEMSTGSSVSKRASGTSRARLPLMTRSPLLESEADRLLAQTCSRLSRLSAVPDPRWRMSVNPAKWKKYEVTKKHGASHQAEAAGILDDIRDTLKEIEDKQETDLEHTHDFYVKLRQWESQKLIIDGFQEILAHFGTYIKPRIDFSFLGEALNDLNDKVVAELRTVMTGYKGHHEDFSFNGENKARRRENYPEMSSDGSEEEGEEEEGEDEAETPEEVVEAGDGGGGPDGSSSKPSSVFGPEVERKSGPSGTEPVSVVGNAKKDAGSARSSVKPGRGSSRRRGRG